MKKIMVVDDDDVFLNEITDTLAASGYDVIPINNSINVFNRAWIEEVDLILLDIRLDGRSGFQLAYELKNSYKTKHIPIIAMTGYYTKEDQWLLMKDLGFVERLVKPINPLDVISIIEKNV